MLQVGADEAKRAFADSPDCALSWSRAVVRRQLRALPAVFLLPFVVTDAAAAGPLSDADAGAVNVLVEKTKGLADLYCTGCGYCMPCSQGVDIPARFQAMNYLKVYGLQDYARQHYERLRAREEKTEGKGVCTE